MKKEQKYRIELTPTQLLELMEWHESHVDKYRKMGIKKDFLKFHQNDNLATFIRESYNLINLKEAIDGEYDHHISQQGKA